MTLEEIEAARLVTLAFSAKGGVVLLGFTDSHAAYHCAVAHRMHQMLAAWEAEKRRNGWPECPRASAMWLRDTLKTFGITHDQLKEGLNLRLRLVDAHLLKDD